MRTNSINERSLEAIVFDIGGVLLDWDPRYLYRKLIPDPAEMEWFLANVCTPQWHEQHDRGLSTAESCAALARQWPQYADLIMAWSERGEEMVGGPLPAGVKLLHEVTGSGLRRLPGQRRGGRGHGNAGHGLPRTRAGPFPAGLAGTVNAALRHVVRPSRRPDCQKTPAGPTGRSVRDRATARP